MRRITALLCAAALLGVGATAASSAVAAAPPSTPASAEGICEKRGGSFINVSPLVYVCLFTSANTDQDREKARRTCEKRGGFFVDVSPVIYACVLPGGPLRGPFS